MVWSVVHLPRAFSAADGPSFLDLVRESEYFQRHLDVTEILIAVALRHDPECLAEWRQYSDDKRVTSGWSFEKASGGYQVAYFPGGPTEVFSDQVEGCAAFVKRELEDIRRRSVGFSS